MMKKSKFRVVTIISVVFAIIVCSLVGTVIAKYVKKSVDENGIEATNIYFKSNYLLSTDEAIEYEISTSSVTITLSNYIDSYHYTMSDLDYSITATNATLSLQSGTISGGATNEVSFTVTPTDTTEPVVVTAQSNSPFSRTLTGTFDFSNIGINPTYMITDSVNSDYATLKIMAGNSSIPANTLSISWNASQLYLDPTNPYLMGNPSINSGNLTISTEIPARTTAVIYIFKNDISQNYSVSETVISSNNISIF